MTVGFHRKSVLFSYEISVRFVLSFYEISMMVGCYPSCDLGDSSFFSITRFQRQSVMVGFISLRDLNNGRFCSFVPLQDFRDGRLLFLTKILVTAGFVLLRDFNDGWFCSFTRSQ